MSEYYSKWYGASVCEKCNHELSFNEEFYAMGTCAYCGYCNGHTVCDTKQVVKREVYIYKPILFGLFKVRKLIRTEIR